MTKSVLAYILAFVSFVTIFGQFFYTIIPFSLVLYFDELLIVAFVSLAMIDFVRFRVNKIYLRLGIIVVAFLAVSYLSPYFQGSPYAIFGALIHIKLFIVVFLFARILEGREYVVRKLLYAVVVFSIFGLIVHFITQESFNHFFNLKVDYRNGLLRLAGFNLSPNYLALFATLIWLYACLARINVRFQQIILYTVSLMAFLFVFLGARSPILIVILGLLVHMLMTRKFIYNLALLLLASPVIVVTAIMLFNFSGDLLAMTLNDVSRISGDTTYIRGRMIFHGFELGARFFPFGAGLNTFGTKMSEGSMVYYDVGLSGHYRASEGVGIYDSNMASVVGELGLFGAVIMIYLLWILYRYFACRSSRKPYYAALTLSILLFGLTNPVLMSGVDSVMYAIFYILPLAKDYRAGI